MLFVYCEAVWSAILATAWHLVCNRATRHMQHYRCDKLDGKLALHF